VSEPFFSPTIPVDSRTEVFLRYLSYFRSRLTVKLEALPAAEWRRTRLPSGWTPLQLLKHLRHVERRWLEWGFEGRDVGDPWADSDGDRWSVADEKPRPRCSPTCAAKPNAAASSSPPTTSTRWAGPVPAGTAPTRPPSSGSCSTWSRSTPATWVSWT